MGTGWPTCLSSREGRFAALASRALWENNTAAIRKSTSISLIGETVTPPVEWRRWFGGLDFNPRIHWPAMNLPKAAG
jgi:hypothetical protein